MDVKTMDDAAAARDTDPCCVVLRRDVSRRIPPPVPPADAVGVAVTTAEAKAPPSGVATPAAVAEMARPAVGINNKSTESMMLRATTWVHEKGKTIRFVTNGVSTSSARAIHTTTATAVPLVVGGAVRFLRSLVLCDGQNDVNASPGIRTSKHRQHRLCRLSNALKNEGEGRGRGTRDDSEPPCLGVRARNMFLESSTLIKRPS